MAHYLLTIVYKQLEVGKMKTLEARALLLLSVMVMLAAFFVAIPKSNQSSYQQNSSMLEPFSTGPLYSYPSFEVNAK